MGHRLNRLLLALLMLLPATARAHWEERDLHGRFMFGYAGVEGDPAHTAEIEANGIPTNVQSISVAAASEDLGPKINFVNSRGQRAIVILDRLLFLNDPALATPCGPYAWRQRLDYKAKFDAWFGRNAPHLAPEKVAILVINSEVNNRCISASALDAVTQYVAAKAPSIPTLAGYGAGEGAQPLPEIVPASLSGVALFRYEVLNPLTDPRYQQPFQTLKSRLTPAQRILLVPDGFYNSGHAARGISQEDMGRVALNYMTLALNDPQVVGMLIFLWPNFSEFGEQKLGTRGLPQEVRDRHRVAAQGLGVRNPFATKCN